MKLIYDTNIVLDVMLKRDPYYTDSAVALNLSEQGDVEGIIAVTSLTDIFYITHKKTHDKDKAYDAMEIIRDVLTVCDVTGDSAEEAIDERSRDFEDELIAKTALKAGCDYILTRNVKDYAKSPVKAITPKELIKIFP